MTINNRLTDYIDDFTELKISSDYGYATHCFIWPFTRRLCVDTRPPDDTRPSPLVIKMREQYHAQLKNEIVNGNQDNRVTFMWIWVEASKD